MKNYYPENEYHTPQGTSRALGDYLCLGTRLYFCANVFGVVWRARQMALNHEFNDSNWVDTSFQILQCHEQSGAVCHFTGLNNISAADGPVVFVGNHMSTAETFLMPAILVPRKKTTFVVKKGLMHNCIFGPVIDARDPIVVERKDPREDFKTVIKEGQEKLKKGVSIVIFPQATRMPVFKPENFNSLGVKLAKKAGVPIVPFALKTDFWGNGSLWKEAGPLNRQLPVHIEFAPPLKVEGTGKEEHTFVVDFIQKKLKEWEV
jgi:1-acyl-sn-glycerol-3-phosphate acyltransferase